MTNRRDFGKIAMSGAFGALLADTRAARATVHPSAPGIKLCAQSAAAPTDEQLLFLKQIGAEYVSVGSTPDLRTAEGFQQIKKRYADAGITVWNIGNTSVHNMPEVTLNLPGRDQKVEEYKQYLRNLGKAGIYYTTYAHMGNGIWSSGRANIRGASGREFDMADPNKQGVWDGKTWKEPLSHGRVFTKEEIWENYTYFIKQVAPVAEEAGVRIGIHPDDPPVPVLAGVPRCIFGNFEGYKRALEIANSPNVGICLCCGTWLEGGKQLTGKDPEEMIRYFGAKKIWKIHFRNVSAPLPHFVETFMDNGYYDMYKIMKALRDVNYDGIVILDHSPNLVGGANPQMAYGFAYMRALLNRANAEAKAVENLRYTQRSVMKIAILLITATALTAQTPAQQRKQPAPPRDGIPASHGDDTKGYNDTPQLPNQKWKVHDMERPRAPKVTPGPMLSPAPPSDAIVLFDGKDLSHWVQGGRGGQTQEPKWKVENGYLEIVPRTGKLITKEKFGDCQLHVEWMIPVEATGSGQGRGNSGVELMTRYEIQVLESNQNLTYADGAAGAMYGAWPPLVNPARPQGEWNAYDIMFEAPAFRRRQSWSSPPTSPCSSTACSCRITRSSSAPPSGARSPNTPLTPPRSP